MQHFTIATRESRLALWQAEHVRDALTARNGDVLAPLVDADRLRTSLAARIRARYVQGPDQRVPIEPVVIESVEIVSA